MELLTGLTKLKTSATLISILLLLTSCSTLTNLSADYIRDYCATTTEAERTVIRERFNAKVHPHQVLIYCEK